MNWKKEHKGEIAALTLFFILMVLMLLTGEERDQERIDCYTTAQGAHTCQNVRYIGNQ